MSSQSAERIGGWLLAPLAWLLLALLSTSLSLILYANALMAPQTGIAESHELWPSGALAGFAAVRRRDVVLYPVADDSVFQTPRGGTQTLHYLAAYFSAAGD